MKPIVMLSGGVGSYMVARRLMEAGEDPLLLFADTKMEDEDLYRFLDDIERVLDRKIKRLEDGRDPWQVFFDVKLLGNSQKDPCSYRLKRKLLREWLELSYEPHECLIHIGIDWTEIARFKGAAGYWEPYQCRAPLTEPPYLAKKQMLEILEADGIEIPRLYKMGFPHNNCGGFCVKAGMAHFALLLKAMPERYAYHERKEQELRDYLGKDVSIMRDRKVEFGIPEGQKMPKGRPVTMKAFRERIEAGQSYDLFEWGGCACFTPTDYYEEADDEDG